MERYHYADEKKPYITAWTHTEFYTTREPDPESEWDIGDSSGELIGYGVSIGRPKEKNRYDSEERSFNEEDIGFMPKVGDVVYMVIERYSDGCTFGNTDGYHLPVHIFKTYEEANNWTESKEAQAFKYDSYFGGHQDWLIKEVLVKEGLEHI